MSMYANYLKERTTDLILETDKGFATYRFLDDKKAVYIIDLYVDPDFRKTGEATNITDTIAEIARGRGYTTLFGSVVPSTRNATVNMKIFFDYGMALDSAGNDFIVLRKDI